LPPQGEFVVKWTGHRFERISADPKAIDGRDKPSKKEKPKREHAFIPGSYRGMFSCMPPLRHDKDPAQSEVLAHIAAELDANGKDADKAQSVFDNIRQPARKILRYSQTTKRWQGVDWKGGEDA
jgi:hypothetical protein